MRRRADSGGVHSDPEWTVALFHPWSDASRYHRSMHLPPLSGKKYTF